VLISAGAWGTGDVLAPVDELAGLPSTRTVVLTGHNNRLRHQLAGRPRCLPLGWQDDVPSLFATADVLVDNAGGTMCAEAFAAGLPVVSHRPLPGHGRVGAQALVDARVVADGRGALCATVQALCTPGPLRQRQRRRAAELFRADPAKVLLDWLARTASPTGGCCDSTTARPRSC
jgi:UDP-N-acetylglucosamine:LPS N-acetylglucosamine transferase